MTEPSWNHKIFSFVRECCVTLKVQDAKNPFDTDRNVVNQSFIINVRSFLAWELQKKSFKSDDLLNPVRSKEKFQAPEINIIENLKK